MSQQQSFRAEEVLLINLNLNVEIFNVNDIIYNDDHNYEKTRINDLFINNIENKDNKNNNIREKS